MNFNHINFIVLLLHCRFIHCRFMFVSLLEVLPRPFERRFHWRFRFESPFRSLQQEVEGFELSPWCWLFAVERFVRIARLGERLGIGRWLLQRRQLVGQLLEAVALALHHLLCLKLYLVAFWPQLDPLTRFEYYGCSGAVQEFVDEVKPVALSGLPRTSYRCNRYTYRQKCCAFWCSLLSCNSVWSWGWLRSSPVSVSSVFAFSLSSSFLVWPCVAGLSLPCPFHWWCFCKVRTKCLLRCTFRKLPWESFWLERYPGPVQRGRTAPAFLRCWSCPRGF